MSWLWWRRPPILQVVLVNLKHDADSALRGVLWSQRGRWLTLKQAHLLAEGESKPLVGDILVPRDNVAFVQQLPPASGV